MNPLHASILASVAVLVGCELKAPEGRSGEADPPAATDAPTLAGPQPPALYSGVLPCADCAGIRYELDLRPDGVYFLRTTYLGTEPTGVFDDIGRWDLDEARALVVLRGGRPAPEVFSIEDAVTLRKRDLEGREIESGLNYDITLQRAYVPLEPALRLRGMYRLTGAMALLEECLTGLELRVIEPADQGALRQAYEALRSAPQQPALAIFTGRIVKQPAISGAAAQNAAIVERFEQVEPQGACDTPEHTL